MCHLLLLMPVLALPIFWLSPLSVSLPVYTSVVIVSAALYAVVMKAMHRPVETGKEGILHARGRVVSEPGEPLEVQIDSERWQALSDERLEPGETVSVTGVDGLTLRVAPAGERSAAAFPTGGGGPERAE